MRRRRLLAPGLILIVVATVVVLFSDITGRQIIGWFPGFRFQRSRIVTSSSIVLREARAVFDLNTVEYVYRSIFPFDFMPEDQSINDILARLRREEGSVEEILSPSELEYFRAFNLASELGMTVGPNPESFVVVTVVVTAGFALEETIFDDPEAYSEEERLEYFRVVPYEDASGTARLEAVIRLPTPVITSVAIEDIRLEEYPYPDVRINASGWRRITEFVGERVAQRTVEAGILETAAANGREFVQSMLNQSGYDRVTFAPEAENR